MELTVYESEDSVKDVKIYVKESKNPYLLIQSTGTLIFCYFILPFIITMFFEFKYPMAKKLYRFIRGDEIMWPMTISLILLKVFLGFFGRFIRFTLPTLYVLDCIWTTIIVFNLLFWFDDYGATETGERYVEKLIIIIMMLFFSSTGIIISPIIIGNAPYNYYIVWGMTMLCSLSAIVLQVFIAINVNTPTVWYLECLLVIWMFNFYIIYNGELVVRYRNMKFHIDDAFWNFYSYHIDWCTYYLRDIIMNSKPVIKMQKIRKQREKEAKERLEAKKRKKLREQKRALRAAKKQKKMIKNENKEPIHEPQE